MSEGYSESPLPLITQNIVRDLLSTQERSQLGVETLVCWCPTDKHRSPKFKERIKTPFRRPAWSRESTWPVPRPANLHPGGTYVYFWNLIFGGRRELWSGGLPWLLGKESTHQAPRFSPHTGNSLFRTLIGIAVTLLTEGMWGIWETWSLKESGNLSPHSKT
jgi:hypothetical protein